MPGSAHECLRVRTHQAPHSAPSGGFCLVPRGVRGSGSPPGEEGQGAFPEPQARAPPAVAKQPQRPPSRVALALAVAQPWHLRTPGPPPEPPLAGSSAAAAACDARGPQDYLCSRSSTLTARVSLGDDLAEARASAARAGRKLDLRRWINAKFPATVRDEKHFARMRKRCYRLTARPVSPVCGGPRGRQGGARRTRTRRVDPKRRYRGYGGGKRELCPEIGAE